MPLKKGKRTFLKIKEKMVFLPPKKLLGRKFLGVAFVVTGSLVLTFSLFYFWLMPKFFPQEPVFAPVRVLIPSQNLDFRLGEAKIEEGAFKKLAGLKEGEVVLLLGKSTYRLYLTTRVGKKSASDSAGLTINDRSLKLILINQKNNLNRLMIEAQQEDL